MIKVEELGFENLEDMEFATAPKCECGCGDAVSLVIEKKEEVGDVVRSILGEFECPSSGGFVVDADGVCKMFFPVHLIEGGDYEPGVFGAMEAKTNEEYSKKDALNLFVNIVNDYDLHHIVILEENLENRGRYRIVSEAS